MFPIVDVSDTTMAASGTTKRISINNILACSPTATLASATITGAATVGTTLGVTGVSTFAAGTALLPALTTTGDVNTGIYYPAADTFAVTTGGTERYRVDSAGNLGVGVTPSAWWSGFKAYESSNGVALLAQTNVPYLHFSTNAYDGVPNWLYKVSSNYALRYAQDGTTGNHLWFNAASGTAGNAITWTQAMTLDASGRLLVGTVTSGTAAGDGIVRLGTYGHCISQTGTSIASGSSVDLTVVTSGAGYQGFLSVANTQDASANTRTQTTYSVFGRGTASTITQIATANGSLGGASFTVTTPSNGVIRITNTSGAAASISAQFFGGASA
jgi:hypothetical protein